MANITFHGNSITTIGNLPEVGSEAKDFTLVDKSLAEKSLADFSGKRKILNVFPSIDTGICAASARAFNEKAGDVENTVVINISKDLPFALERFCAAEGLNHVVNLSDFRGSFVTDYQVNLADSVLKGLHSRAVLVLDENNKVLYTEQVPEIGQEPNYEGALAALKS